MNVGERERRGAGRPLSRAPSTPTVTIRHEDDEPDEDPPFGLHALVLAWPAAGTQRGRWPAPRQPARGGAGRRPATPSGSAGAREVVPRRRGGGGPLEGAAPAPRVVDLDAGRGLPRLVDVPHERERRSPEHERADRRERVEEREAVAGQVVGVATRHADGAQPVLDQERRLEADEEQPEVDLAQPLVEHLAR